MRPLALRIQAFGSYAGELVIDFARLGRHGVFSITGPTGAGKSTIFDAIVYALYDDLPGFRVNSHVRSQHALPGTRTEVTLEFEAEGRHWVLTRAPAQSRPSARGAALVDDPSRVLLAEAGGDGGGLSRKRDVTERLGELVGLTKAQFEQVVLLPQGRFEEVLKAGTQERATLLARLFPVDVFVRTTDALRELAATRGEAYEALTQGRRTVEDRIRVDVAAVLAEADGAGATPPDDEVDLARLPDLRVRLDAVLAGVTGRRDAAGAAREAATDRRAAAEAAAERWARWRADLAEAAGHAAEEAADAEVTRTVERAATVATLRRSLDAWLDATDRLGTLDAARADLRAAVGAAGSGRPDGDGAQPGSATEASLLASTLVAEATALEEAARRFDELVAQGTDLERAEAGRDRRTAELASASDAAGRQAADLAAAEAGLADLATSAAARTAAAVRVEALERDAAAVRDRLVAERALAAADAEEVGARRRLAAAEEAAAGVRAAWRAGLAGRLAAHLEDGAPCPTCGATSHPAPAAPDAGAPDDDELEAAEEAAREAGESLRAAEAARAGCRARLDSSPAVEGADGLATRLEAAQAELAAAEAAEAARTAGEELVTGLRAAVAAAEEELARERSALVALDATLVERRTRWEADRDAFAAAHGAFASTAAAAAGRRQQSVAVAELADNLAATEAAARTRDEHAGTLAPTLAEFGVDDPGGLRRWALSDAELAEARAGLTARADRRREVTDRIAAYVDGGGGEQPPDVDSARRAEAEAATAHEALVGRAAAIAGRLSSIDAAVTELADGAAAVADALAAKEEADTLAGLCAGHGGGPDASRLSLKNWVLAYYLRQVLAHANRRLDTMTNGRYALTLSEEHGDGRRPWGLDIAVRDAETGHSRPATTLSGGETFMAALSLALGLADVVSAGSDYSIGALFVDEGFGSLDGDSLDTVVEVLRSLQDGGRMVGVISHVQELQSALPNGITIASSTAGSVATIHYPDA